MLLNEGLISGTTAGAVKSEMIRQLERLGPTDAESWERAVFEALTGGRREDVDWEVEDNQAGYNLWVRAFDGLVGELVEEGHVRSEDAGGGRRLLSPAE